CQLHDIHSFPTRRSSDLKKTLFKQKSIQAQIALSLFYLKRVLIVSPNTHFIIHSMDSYLNIVNKGNFKLVIFTYGYESSRRYSDEMFDFFVITFDIVTAMRDITQQKSKVNLERR